MLQKISGISEDPESCPTSHMRSRDLRFMRESGAGKMIVPRFEFPHPTIARDHMIMRS